MVHVVCALVALLLAIQPLQGCGGMVGYDPCPSEGWEIYTAEEACLADHKCCRGCEIMVENVTTTSGDVVEIESAPGDRDKGYWGVPCPTPDPNRHPAQDAGRR